MKTTKTSSANKLAKVLRSAASALEHGRKATATAKLRAIMAQLSEVEASPVVVLEGGILQALFIVDPKARRGFRDLSYTLVDYDIFEDETDEEIAERWNNFPPELQRYFQEKLPYEYGKFQGRADRAANQGKESEF